MDMISTGISAVKRQKIEAISKALGDILEANKDSIIRDGGREFNRLRDDLKAKGDEFEVI